MPALDGVRALAVCLVFAFHAAPEVLHGGYVGVDVFFVLSGFLITSLLAREWQVSGSVDRPKFYGRRAVRLVPALVIALVLAVPATLAIHGHGLLGDELAGATYLSDFWALHDGEHTAALGPLWSLAVEEQFYLIWPIVLVVLLRRVRSGHWRWLAAAALVLALVKLVAFEALGWSAVYFTPIGSANELVLGAALGLLLPVAGPRVTETLNRSAVGLAGLIVVMLGAVGLQEVQDPRAYRGGTFLVAVASALLVGHLVVGEGSWLTRLFALAPLRWLGQRSYGIYLYHVAAMALASRLDASRSTRIAVAFLATLLVAALSYRLVERPVSRRLRPRLQATLPRTELSPVS